MHASDIKLAANAIIYYRSGSANSLSQIRSEKSLRAAYLSVKLGCEYLLKNDSSSLMKKLCAAKYQTLLFQAFPAYPSLVKDIETDIKELGGSDGKLEGGVLIKTLQKMVGWKLAIRIKIIIYGSGYEKVVARKRNNRVLQSNLAKTA
jgi:hypothetical protein